MATLAQIKAFFGFSSATQLKEEWGALTDSDKEQIKRGIGNGSLTY